MRHIPPLSVPTATAIAGSAAVTAWLVVTAAPSSNAVIREGAVAVLSALAVWMFFSERYVVTLSVLLLYLGLLDGFLKLRTGSSVATLGRDVLLYSIVLGALTRAIVRKLSLPRPPLLAWVVAWLAICVAQIFNPAAVSITHAAAGIRQHIEFVPLFFVGFLVLRSKQRLIGMFVLLVLVAAANGVVSFVQEHLTPGQLAAWGPGYAREVFGTASLSTRTFFVSGMQYVRPPALGGDFGFGGMLGLIAIPGGLVLLAEHRRLKRLAWVVGLAAPLVVAAVVTSQSRTAVIGSAVALITFLGLTVSSRRDLTVLAVTLLVGAMSYVVVQDLLPSSSPNRYSSIAPGKVLATTTSYREGTLSLIPTYAARYPLGDGMGSTGAAASSAIGGGVASHSAGLNAESEFTFLEVELGLPGLAVFLALTIASLAIGLRLRRIGDSSLQRPLMALVAVLAALLACWIARPVSALSPDAPCFWLYAGALAYWYQEMRAGRVNQRQRAFTAAR